MLVCVCKNWKEQVPGHPGAEHIPHTTLCPSKQERGELLELSQDMLNSPHCLPCPSRAIQVKNKSIHSNRVSVVRRVLWTGRQVCQHTTLFWQKDVCMRRSI